MQAYKYVIVVLALLVAVNCESHESIKALLTKLAREQQDDGIQAKVDEKVKDSEFTPRIMLSDTQLRRILIVFLARVEARIEESKLKKLEDILLNTDPEDIDETKAWQFIKQRIGDMKLND